jgi:hypothetical protein
VGLGRSIDRQTRHVGAHNAAVFCFQDDGIKVSVIRRLTSSPAAT